jgi:hypothetical protein
MPSCLPLVVKVLGAVEEGLFVLVEQTTALERGYGKSGDVGEC